MHGNQQGVQPLWAIAYAGGADVVLSGHEHDYERFAPQDAAGNLDQAFGVREFVVGTGGYYLYALGTRKPNSEAFSSTYGVHQADAASHELRLAVHPRRRTGVHRLGHRRLPRRAAAVERSAI